MNRRIPHWNKTNYPYTLMYRKNEEGILDIVKVYKNMEDKYTNYKIVGKGRK
jgi:hypothetical protein